jgi:hypothetical protein
VTSGRSFGRKRVTVAARHTIVGRVSIDGFRTLDPVNAGVKPMRSPTTSILEVPANPPRIWAGHSAFFFLVVSCPKRRFVAGSRPWSG